MISLAISIDVDLHVYTQSAGPQNVYSYTIVKLEMTGIKLQVCIIGVVNFYFLFKTHVVPENVLMFYSWNKLVSMDINKFVSNRI